MERTILDVVIEGGVKRPGVRMENATFRYTNGVVIDLDNEALMEFEAMLKLLNHVKNVMEEMSHQPSPQQTQPVVDSDALRKFLGKAERKPGSDKKDKEETNKSGE